MSAAITARQRDKRVTVMSNDAAGSGLYKAAEVRNYPGLPNISGAKLLAGFTAQAVSMGAVVARERVSVVLPVGGAVSVNSSGGVTSAGAVVLAIGVAQTTVFPGELELLGRGVSYCATCDGMFFRKKRVCVIMQSADAESEAAYLESIGCEVVRLTPRTGSASVNGGGRVESVTVDGATVECAGVFILRDTVLPSALAAGIALSDGCIGTDHAMRTSLPGVFAAGDCTGTPYQIAKAVGQGQIAALSAVEYIDKN
jgi:thioredoxin reductase (NADPH)